MALFDRKASSLNSLKRTDPEIDEVVASAGQVCLYIMQADSGKWARKNVEGPLFLVRRRRNPRFQLVVMNKLGTDNYVESVAGDMEVEVNAPYLMYTWGDELIHGIWFSEESDLQGIMGPLERILAQMPAGGGGGGDADVAPAAGQAAVPGHASPAGGDDGFWDRSVHVTESQLPPTQALAAFSLGTGPAAAAAAAAAATAGLGEGGQQAPGGGFQNMLRQAQQRAPVPAPQPAAAAAPVPIAAAPVASSAGSGGGALSSTPPAAPLLTPSTLLQARAGQEGGAAALGNGMGAGNSGNPLQQLLSRANRPGEPTAPPQPAPMPPPAAPPVLARPEPPQPMGQPPLQPLMPAPAQLRTALRQALARALQHDAFVDALAMELHATGLLRL